MSQFGYLYIVREQEMRLLTIITISVLLVACNRNDDLPQIPSWGHLPKLNTNHWDIRQKCKDIDYSRIPFGVSDIGDTLHPMGKKASGVSHGIYLGQTCILASISTTVYETPEDQWNNHYTISVQIPQPDNRCTNTPKPNFCKNNPKSFRVIFSRDIPGNEVGQYFIDKKMEDVVSFDDSSRRVIFKVRDNRYEYIVPVL